MFLAQKNVLAIYTMGIPSTLNDFTENKFLQTISSVKLFGSNGNVTTWEEKKQSWLNTIRSEVYVHYSSIIVQLLNFISIKKSSTSPFDPTYELRCLYVPPHRKSCSFSLKIWQYQQLNIPALHLSPLFPSYHITWNNFVGAWLDVSVIILISYRQLGCLRILFLM